MPSLIFHLSVEREFFFFFPGLDPVMVDYECNSFMLLHSRYVRNSYEALFHLTHKAYVAYIAALTY